MLVRFFKILVGVFVAHLIVLSVVWVGFSTPLPRAPATFTFEGALPAEDLRGGADDVWQKAKSSDRFVLDHPLTIYSNQWVGLRDPSKSKTYGHLGF